MINYSKRIGQEKSSLPIGMTPPFHSSPAYLHFCTYGFTMTCEELIKQGASLSAASAGRRTLGAATEVSLEYFQREREAGLYDGEWPLDFVDLLLGFCSPHLASGPFAMEHHHF